MVKTLLELQGFFEKLGLVTESEAKDYLSLVQSCNPLFSNYLGYVLFLRSNLCKLLVINIYDSDDNTLCLAA